MGIFSSIVNAIFGSKAAAASRAAKWLVRAGGWTRRAAAPTPISRAEVEAIIAKIEADRGVKYNWKQSIVDLMKLLDLDSSARGAQGARAGARLHGRARRLGRDECLAAQAGDGRSSLKAAARCRTA